jgi:hypothetical protein
VLPVREGTRPEAGTHHSCYLKLLPGGSGIASCPSLADPSKIAASHAGPLLPATVLTGVETGSLHLRVACSGSPCEGRSAWSYRLHPGFRDDRRSRPDNGTLPSADGSHQFATCWFLLGVPLIFRMFLSFLPVSLFSPKSGRARFNIASDAPAPHVRVAVPGTVACKGTPGMAGAFVPAGTHPSGDGSQKALPLAMPLPFRTRTSETLRR